MSFWVYMLANRKNGALYVGHTDDLPKRIWQHRNKVLPGHTAKYDITLLVWMEPYPTREEARVREKRLQHWNRAWKIELIERLNPEWRDLYDDLNNWDTRNAS